MKTSWHKAKNPPDDEITVLVHLDDGAVEPAYHDGDCWRFLNATRIREKVVHWCPLPEPPTK
jgi:hypothetical protein